LTSPENYDKRIPVSRGKIIVVATNRKAYRDYHIIKTFEAGIVLLGNEVKSLRQRKVGMKDAYAKVVNGEVWLYNLHISPYEKECIHTDPERPRKLLLHKSEIKRLYGMVSEKGYTLIPLKIYFNERGVAKVELAVAKGKKQYEKKEELKRRIMEREMKEEGW